MTFSEAAMIMMSGGSTSSDTPKDKINKLPDIAVIKLGNSGYSVHIKTSYLYDDITINAEYNFGTMANASGVFPYITSRVSDVYIYFCGYHDDELIVAESSIYAGDTADSYYWPNGTEMPAPYLSYHSVSQTTGVRNAKITAYGNTPISPTVTVPEHVYFEIEADYVEHYSHYDENGNVVRSGSIEHTGITYNASIPVNGLTTGQPEYICGIPDDPMKFGEELMMFGNAVCQTAAEDIQISYFV